MAMFLQSTTRPNIRYQILRFDPASGDMRLKSVSNGTEFTMPKMTASEITRLDYKLENVPDPVPNAAPV